MYKVTYSNGKVVNFSKQPTEADIKKVAEQLGISKTNNTSSSVSKKEDPKKQGLLKSLAGDIVRPFAEVGVGLYNAGRTAASGFKKDYTEQSYDLPLVGKTKPFLTGGESNTETAKKVLGYGLDIGSNFVGVGGAKTVGKTALKQGFKQVVKTGAKEGAKVGALMGAGKALQNNENVVVGAGEGALGGALLGGTIGGATSIGTKLISKTARNNALVQKVTSYLEPRLNPNEKADLARAGKFRLQSLTKGEKYVPSPYDKQVAKTAVEFGVKGKNPNSDIVSAQNGIEKLATELKTHLKDNGAIWNRNTIISRLNKLKNSDTMRLALKGKDDKTLYNEFVAITDKLLKSKKGGTLDELLDVRIEIDNLAKRADKNVFSKHDSPLYHATTSIRNTINDYIREKGGDDIVSMSLEKQSHLYNALENISLNAAKGGQKLLSSKINATLKKQAKYIVPAGGVVGIYEISRKLKNIKNTEN